LFHICCPNLLIAFVGLRTLRSFSKSETIHCWIIILYIFLFCYLLSELNKIPWFPILKNSELQRAKNTRICNYFCMKIEKPLLLWTLMVPLVFENFDFKGTFPTLYFENVWCDFLGSWTSPWTQISHEGTFFDAEHDDFKNFRIFENFGKSRNQFWDPPFINYEHEIQ